MNKLLSLIAVASLTACGSADRETLVAECHVSMEPACMQICEAGVQWWVDQGADIVYGGRTSDASPRRGLILPSENRTKDHSLGGYSRGGYIEIYLCFGDTLVPHELGHALGLKHSDHADNLMNPKWNRGIELTESQREVLGIAGVR